MAIRFSFRCSRLATSSSWTISAATASWRSRRNRGSRRELLHLPPYSPDFNPIEKAFSKFKALLRKASERTVEGLWSTIGALIPASKPNDCANFFAASGYDAA
jgi:transposase